MHKTRSVILLLLGVALYSSASIAQEADVKFRKSIMQAISGHAGAIAQIAYGGVDYSDRLASHVRALKELSDQVELAFKNKAMTEDPPTRAKSEIWQDWEKFIARIDDFKAAVDGVVEEAAGDISFVAPSLDPLWDSCKGCHKNFRKKE